MRGQEVLRPRKVLDYVRVNKPHEGSGEMVRDEASFDRVLVNKPHEGSGVFKYVSKRIGREA